MRTEMRWGEIAQGGQNAYRDGSARDTNPYMGHTVASAAWFAGWEEGEFRTNKAAPPKDWVGPLAARDVPVLISTRAHRTW
jgi:hypothetical protein